MRTLHPRFKSAHNFSELGWNVVHFRGFCCHQQQQQQNAIYLSKRVFINLIYVSSHFKQIKLVCTQQEAASAL